MRSDKSAGSCKYDEQRMHLPRHDENIQILIKDDPLWENCFYVMNIRYDIPTILGFHPTIILFRCRCAGNWGCAGCVRYNIS